MAHELMGLLMGYPIGGMAEACMHPMHASLLQGCMHWMHGHRDDGPAAVLAMLVLQLAHGAKGPVIRAAHI